MPRRVASFLGAAELVTKAETKIHLILPRLHKMSRIFCVVVGTIWGVNLVERITRSFISVSLCLWVVYGVRLTTETQRHRGHAATLSLSFLGPEDPIGAV